MAGDEELARHPFRKENKLPIVTNREIGEPQSESSWHGGNPSAQVSDWQSEMSIGGATSKFVKSLGLGAVFLVIPLAFMALGIVIAVLNGHEIQDVNVFDRYLVPADSVAWSIQQVLKQAVSLWPTLFGIVLCATLRSAATYKAERGTELRTLEQIMGARSLGSVATSPLSFRKINVTTIALMSLWGFSYIGTQALQRIFSTEVLSMHIGHTNFSFVDTRIAPDNSGGGTNSATSTDLMLAAFLIPASAIAESSVDPWNNPKIPDLDSVSHLHRDKQGWIDLTHMSVQNDKSSTGIYTSIVGVPIRGLDAYPKDSNAVTKFTMVTSYFSFHCQEFKNYTGNQVRLSRNKDGKNVISGSSPGAWACIQSSPGCGIEGSNGLGFGLTYQTHPPHILEEVALANWQHAPNEIGNPKPTEKSIFEVTTCSVKPYTVEVEMSCQSSSCIAAKMRAQENPKPLPLPGQGAEGLWENAIPSAFLQSTMVPDLAGDPTGVIQQSWYTTELERWLVNPNDAMNTSVEWEKFSNLPIEVFSKRLSMAFNTFWIVLQSQQDMVLGPTAKAWNTSQLAYDNVAKQTRAMETRFYRAYVCYWPWFGVLLGCCMVVIFIIAARVYYDTHVLGPDVMGYVSGLIRNNPYVHSPPGGSLLDGMEVTRKLGDMKVRLQDVRPADHLGHVALATVDGEPLKRGRSYW